MLPPWLSSCEAFCQAGEPFVAKACPASNPGCVPARETRILPTVDGYRIDGALLTLGSQIPLSVSVVSNGGFTHPSAFWWSFRPGAVLQSDLDVSLGFYGDQPVWGGDTVVPYVSQVRSTALLESTVIHHVNYAITADLHSGAEVIIIQERDLLGWPARPIRAVFLPTDLLGAVNGEGNFSYGDGRVTVNYGNPPYIAATGGIQVESLRRFAHEIGHDFFAHVVQFYGYNAQCLNEGMAESIASVIGVLPPEELGPRGVRGTDFRLGCLTANGPHETGYCVFYHIREAGQLTPSFLFRMMRPQHQFDFNSCTLNDPHTANTLLVAMTEAANGADLVPAFNAMKLPHAGSYTAARAAAGL